LTATVIRNANPANTNGSVTVTETNVLAAAFRALANPHRLTIFMELARCCRPGEACTVDERACVGDLAAGLSLAPSTVSHHLKELRQAGIIQMERNGQNVQCWAEPAMLAALEDFFATATRDPARCD
jgi:ArsR family transcriptional regulator